MKIFENKFIILTLLSNIYLMPHELLFSLSFMINVQDVAIDSCDGVVYHILHG